MIIDVMSLPFMAAPPPGSYLEGILVFLRNFNGWLALVVLIACLARFVLKGVFWRQVHGRTEGNFMEKTDLSKEILFVANTAAALAAWIGSFAHRSFNSPTGVFVPISTVVLLLIGLAIFAEFRNYQVTHKGKINVKSIARRFKR